MRRRKNAPSRLDEAAPDLTTLAPKYSFRAHGVYFTILKSTLESKPNVHNIALAGTYGAGKSSILREVAKEFPNQVVEISLLTLGAKDEALPRTPASDINAPPRTPASDINPAAASKTNRIQKEIVKQLLYKQKPTKSPGSRFHRIVRLNGWAEAGVAALVAAVAVGLGLLAGLDVVTTPVFGITFTGRPHVVGVLALFLALATLAAAASLVVRALLRGRVSIDKVTAGPATITLPSRSASYFDEYLDEIIYFFETNKKLDIVIIEDLDRFNDPNIFESLHSLNGILNSAKQLGGRDVRFIYAVRDSVFEKLGRDELEDVTDEARAELIRANRTKFFELVIPVVPFITHRNARDLMARELAERGHNVSKDLIDLAARHLADMRLIHNIINEYEVFEHRLLDVPLPVPELTVDRLFALVLFKNAHMADFEDIRHGTSSLDKLWNIARDLIRTNADRLRGDIRTLRRRVQKHEEVKDYAAILGSALTSRIEVLAHAPATGLAAATLTYEGVAVESEELQTPEFWRRFVTAETPLTVDAHLPGYNYGTQPMQLSRSTVETLTGMSLDVDRFETHALARTERDIKANEEELSELLRMSWENLADDESYTVGIEGSPDRRSFSGWAGYLLPSRLAVDLVEHGYITSYFPLHVSSFYGTVVRPRAMTYVMRFVDNRKADPDFRLDPHDVEAIIWSEGPSVLTERSMLNVSIIDHLLESRREDARLVITNLADDADLEDFVARFLEAGSFTTMFVAMLASHWDGVFEYLLASTAVDGADRMRLIDAAIVNRDKNRTYSVPPGLKPRIESGYRDLPSLAVGARAEDARSTAQFIDTVGAVLPDLDDLPEAALEVLQSSGSYEVNRRNLEILTGSTDISLDALSDAHPYIAEFVAESPRAYVEACRESEFTRHTVQSDALFARFLAVAGTSDPDACRGFVKMAGPDCKIAQIADVPATTWGSLFRYRHATTSFENVSRYLEHRGEVDDELARSLSSTAELEEWEEYDEDARREVALAVVNSPSDELTATKRVALAASLEPGILSAEDLQPQSGELVGRLIREGLVADDEAAFAARLMVDWETQSYTIANSKNFADFVSPATLDVNYVAPILADDALTRFHYPVTTALSRYPKIPLAAYQAFTDRALSGATYIPNASGIKRARKVGVSVDLVLQLLAKFKTNVSHEELRDIVRTLGSPWAKLADPGHGKSTQVPYSPHAQTVLEELRSAGVVKNITRRGEVLNVTRRQK